MAEGTSPGPRVRDTGIIGDVTTSCGNETAGGANITMDFESVVSGTQKWTQVTTTGTKYRLTAVETGVFAEATERTSSLDWSASLHFTTATKITCP
jgi:hypothetical protein